MNKASERLHDAQQEADQASQSLTKAELQLLSANASLNHFLGEIDAASQTIQVTEIARMEAMQRLDELNESLPRLAQDADVARGISELQAHESAVAREAALQATSVAEIANAEALRLAQEAEAAREVLAAAELAVQQAAESEPTEEASRAYSLNFNQQDDGAFETVVGISERVAGQLHLLPGEDGVAVSVLDNEALPERTATRVYTTVRADALPDLDQNGFVVFDYQSPDDFKYAGAWASADRWAIGEVVDGELVDVATLDEVIGEGPAYELQIWIEDHTLTFLVEGQQKLEHSFDQPIDDGQIGVASDNARSRFDQVAVMQLYGGAGDVGIENAATPQQMMLRSTSCSNFLIARWSQPWILDCNSRATIARRFSSVGQNQQANECQQDPGDQRPRYRFGEQHHACHSRHGNLRRIDQVDCHHRQRLQRHRECDKSAEVAGSRRSHHSPLIKRDHLQGSDANPQQRR